MSARRAISAPQSCANVGRGSRSDAYFGNVLTFNHTVFEETRSYWTDETITIQMAANARQARINTSKATNPTYQMSELGNDFTYGESAAYVVVFGNKTSGTVKRSWVEWLFGEAAPLSFPTISTYPSPMLLHTYLELVSE